MTARWPGSLLVGAGVLAFSCALLVGLRAGHLAEASRGLPQTFAFLVTGWVAMRARPDHRGARRLLLVGVVMAAGFGLGTAYSAYLVHHGTPAWGWAAVLGLQALSLGQGALLLGLLAVFPDGEYRRPYERTVVVVGAAYVCLIVVAARIGSPDLVFPDAFIWGDRVSAPNPGAQLGLSAVGQAAWVGYQAGFLLLLGAGVVLLLLRFRHFSAVERRQTAWPLLGVVVAVATAAVLGALAGWTRTLPAVVVYLLYAPAALAVPASIAVGMVRHQLLDIDAVIRRSSVYAVLWLAITAAYLALTLAFGIAVGGRVPLGPAVALTIGATLLAAPARRWLERQADRLVFGRRLSGYEVISRLGARLEAVPAAEDVADTVAADVLEGLEVRWVRVILDEADSGGQAPGGADVSRSVVGAAGPVPAGATPTLTVPLVRGAMRVGAIECGPKREGRLSASDRQLLESLGRQAALAVHNSWLTRQLAGRLDELEASRARIVQAEDAGRRRLERDLHDGVQQELVVLLARLGLARNQLRRDPALAESSLREVQRDGRRALTSLQDIARGIHPPLLSDRGLAEAVAERVSRLMLPVEVDCSGLANAHPGNARFLADVEGAAYFVVTEALGNVLKHARASRAWVTLAQHDGALHVVVRDDGSGFDAAATTRRGLLGLQDRVEALGGRLTVTSSATGTTLAALIPKGAPSA